MHPFRLVFLLPLLAACSSGGDPVACLAPHAGEIRADFEQAKLEETWSGEAEGIPENFTLVSSPTRKGAGALKLRARKGDVANGGVRSELTWDNQDRAGSDAFYAWSIRLDPSFPDIDRVEDAQGRANWQVMGQWHDQPDCQKGQSWDDIETRGPAVSVNYLWLSSADPKVQALMANGELATVVGFSDAMLERPLFGLIVQDRLRAVTPIEKDQWIDVRIHHHWSRGADGRVQWFVNGQLVHTYEGSTMWSDASQYFKLGLYRNPEIVPDQVFFVDEVFVTRDETAMTAFAEALK
ncbi:heparin lyase I family protein [Polyangium sp. y55x31]|uniref:heparin lyase I family protein n=1 Tax=Polyangium sp. y55x31 TaxID=3042688 RepID=UPI0024831DF2|nr:heparin lyase I family protein [Polyangium sp. y55x31]MDI1483717.1 heparin lyase I family protein [Polyangium sp. y55x31]